MPHTGARTGKFIVLVLMLVFFPAREGGKIVSFREAGLRLLQDSVGWHG